jgi:hypothetical protein
VCGDATIGFETGIQASTFSDGAAVVTPCVNFTAVATATATASGTMVQAGSVSIGLTKSSATANWPFSITIPKGMHTLLAVGAGKAIVQRDLDLEANTTLPAIDVSAGTALAPLSFTPTNAATGATLETRLREALATDFVLLPIVAGTTANTLPSSLLLNTESQSVEMFALTDTSFQSADEAVDANTVTAIDFIPALTGVAFVTGKVSWSSTLPAGDLEMWAFSSTNFNFMHLTPTASWLGTKTELELDTTGIPGFRPEWVADTSAPALAFDVMRSDGGVFLDTEAFTPLSLTAQHARALRRHRGGSLRR